MQENDDVVTAQIAEYLVAIIIAGVTQRDFVLITTVSNNKYRSVACQKSTARVAFKIKCTPKNSPSKQTEFQPRRSIFRGSCGSAEISHVAVAFFICIYFSVTENRSHVEKSHLVGGDSRG